MDNKYLPESGYKRIAVIFFYVIAVTAAAYVIFKYLVGLFLPFIIAWFAAVLLQPLISYLSRRLRLPKKAVSVVVILAVFALAGTLLFMLSDRLLWECGRLFDWLNDNADIITDDVSALLKNLIERIPIAGTVINNEYITSAVSDMIKGALTSISARVPEFIAATVGILPRSLFFIIILVVACFYICADYGEIGGYIERRLPKDFAQLVARIRKQLATTGRHYLRAYTAVLAITFAELLAGLLLLKIDYAFMMALIIAAVDILPVLGSGTVLVPWGAVLLITGNYYTGFGLLIIYAAVTVIRQIIEPKIVGVSLGLHPLVALMAIYAGFRLFGFIGIIVLPITVILSINVFRGEKILNKKKTL